jgi:hypothetical protein
MKAELTDGWPIFPHGTGVQFRHNFNSRVPHSLRFSFLQRVRV